MNIKSRRKFDLHAHLIGEYLARYPQAKSKGFERELKAWGRKNRRTLNINLEKHWSTDRPGFRPDAYIIDDEAECFVVAEIQVTSFIKPAKYEALADFAWLVDGAGWLPVLHTVDRDGVLRAVRLLEIMLALDAPDTAHGREYLRQLHNRSPGELFEPPPDMLARAVSP